jgi:hypothetical protein
MLGFLFSLLRLTFYQKVMFCYTFSKSILEKPFLKVYIRMPLSLIQAQTSGPASIPTKQNQPNNQTKVEMGLPFKPDTMTQGNSFSIGRMAYNRGVNQNVDAVGKGPAPQKKWYGASSSRMSSEHTNLRTIEATGKSSTNRLNAQQTMSFSGPDQTSQKTALARCRGGGCNAPKKKGAINK